LATCKVDRTTSPTLASLLKKLKKKYPHIEDDLNEIIPLIEADYTSQTTIFASRPPKRKLDFEFWKYYFGSTDLRRPPLHSFRVVGVFLEPEEPGKVRTMYLSIAFFKGDQEDVTSEEVKKAVGRLMESINQAELPNDPPPQI
jgi:hypothetical protein